LTRVVPNIKEIPISAKPDAKKMAWVFDVNALPALWSISAPPIPINRIKTKTIVSTRVWADLVGNMKACAPAATPSIRALKSPPARAKNTIKYKTAATVTILDVLGESEDLDKEAISKINQSKLTI
jgi:hypothetical protein